VFRLALVPRPHPVAAKPLIPYSVAFGYLSSAGSTTKLRAGCVAVDTSLVLRQLWLHSGFSREPTSANMLAELSLLRPLSYLGAARPLMLPLFRLLPYLYLPDRATAYTGLTSAVAAISMLSSYRPNTSTSVCTMPTFLFRLAFPRLSNHSLASCYESSPVFLVRVSQFFGYLLRLFCYLLSTILRISQPISKLLTHLLTVL